MGNIMTDDGYPLVWIVIPTWNRRDDLLGCLKSVYALDYPNKRIVVVDNGSTDESASVVQGNFPDVSLIVLPENRGASFASNAGLSFAYDRGADYFLRLDSDTILSSNLLSELVNSAQQYSEAGVLGCKIFYYDQPDVLWSAGAQHKSWYFGTQEIGRGQMDGPVFDQPRQLDYAWSAGILISRKAYEATQGFDTDFFVYFEDPDFCIRVRKAGFIIRYVPTAVMWHKVGELTPNSERAYEWGRGKILFFRKHSFGVHRLGLIIYAYAYALFRAVWRKPNVGNRGPLYAALHGLTAGLMKPIARI